MFSAGCGSGGSAQICLINVDGSNFKELTNGNCNYFPKWSADGNKIVFESQYNDGTDGNYAIYIINFDGSNLKYITNRSTSDEMPSWSPDGTKIVFASRSSTISSNNYQLYEMNSDGSNVTRLTNDSYHDDYPSWAPGNSITPCTVTNPASNISINSACLNGNLVDLGVAANVTTSFEWGTDTNYTEGNIPTTPET